MDVFIDSVLFWLAAVVVYSFYHLGQEVYKDLRAKYIVWAWKRRK